MSFVLLSAAATIVPWRGEWLSVSAGIYIGAIALGTAAILAIGVPKTFQGSPTATIGSALATYSAWWSIFLALRWGPGIGIGSGNLTAPALMLLLCAGLCVPQPRARTTATWWRWYGAACVIYSVVAIVEFLVHTVSPRWYANLPWIAHTYWFYDGTRYHADIVRVQAGFGFPNDFGRFLVPFLVVEGARPLVGPGRRGRRGGAVTLAALGLFLSFSRAAWICAAAGWAAAVAMGRIARRRGATRPRAAGNAARRTRQRTIAIVAAVVVVLAPVLYRRIASLAEFGDRSLTSRIRFLGEMWSEIPSTFFCGDPTILPRDLGSFWWSLAMTWGALPVIVVAVLTVAATLTVWRRRPGPGRSARVALPALALALTVDHLISFNTAVLFFSLLVFALRERRQKDHASPKTPPRARR